MINFIVCEDNKIIRERNIEIINDVMFKNKVDYRVYQFSNYSNELKTIIKSNKKNKIYLLDIELEDSSGLSIATDIRDMDLDSVIILCTSYVEFLPYILKSKLSIFDFISKFENYDANIFSSLDRAVLLYKNQINEQDQIEKGIKVEETVK